MIPRANKLQKIKYMNLPQSYYLGILSMSRFTTYIGFYDLSSPHADEKVFIFAAVGQLLGSSRRRMEVLHQVKTNQGCRQRLMIMYVSILSYVPVRGKGSVIAAGLDAHLFHYLLKQWRVKGASIIRSP